MEKLFKLKENKTKVSTEIIAGLTSFISIVYILAVNPNILSAAGMDRDAIFTATAISAALATLCMAFFANYPVVLASGMGLNAYFAYTVCGPMIEQGITDPWQIALTAVLVEGIIFIILSLFKFRETLVNKVPRNLKLGITAGIGLYIAFIGMQGAGIVALSESTLVDLGSVASAEFALAMIGFILIGVLNHYKVPGAIFLGIIATWVLGMIAEVAGWYVVDPANGVYSLFPDFSNYKVIPAAPAMFKFNFSWVGEHIAEFAVIVFSFLFVDLFDTVGTLICVADKGNLLDKDGNLPRAGGALMADAVGTVVGACLGTSTVTSYIESSAGVAAGGRTGLTAVTAAIMFILALFLSPLFLAIPGFATAPALIYVGLLMLSSVKKMDFEGDFADVMGGFLAIVMMPFTYSIANGIMFGILAWIVLKLCTGKAKDIHPVMWVSGALFIFRIITMVI